MYFLAIFIWFSLVIGMGVGFAYMGARDYRRGWVRRYTWFGEKLSRVDNPFNFYGQIAASAFGVVITAVIAIVAIGLMVKN